MAKSKIINNNLNLFWESPVFYFLLLFLFSRIKEQFKKENVLFLYFSSSFSSSSSHVHRVLATAFCWWCSRSVQFQFLRSSLSEMCGILQRGCPLAVIVVTRHFSFGFWGKAVGNTTIFVYIIILFTYCLLYILIFGKTL